MSDLRRNKPAAVRQLSYLSRFRSRSGFGLLSAAVVYVGCLIAARPAGSGFSGSAANELVRQLRSASWEPWGQQATSAVLSTVAWVVLMTLWWLTLFIIPIVVLGLLITAVAALFPTRRYRGAVGTDSQAVEVTIRAGDEGDQEDIRELLTSQWASTEIARRSELIDAAALANLVAVAADGELLGLLTYRHEGKRWEIVTLDVVTCGRGIGRALLTEFRARASAQGADRVWFITTNDNTDALRFYQRFGFDLTVLHHDSVIAARDLKPGIPLTSNSIPVRHELELAMRL